jgi:hypothetical protein
MQVPAPTPIDGLPMEIDAYPFVELSECVRLHVRMQLFVLHVRCIQVGTAVKR